MIPEDAETALAVTAKLEQHSLSILEDKALTGVPFRNTDAFCEAIELSTLLRLSGYVGSAGQQLQRLPRAQGCVNSKSRRAWLGLG